MLSPRSTRVAATGRSPAATTSVSELDGAMDRHSPLRLLADRVGIASSYVDQTGEQTRITSDETRAAILRAMGIDASTSRAAGEALERMEDREWSRVLAPVRVVRRSDPDAARIEIRAGASAALPAEWSLECTLESGEAVRSSGASQPEWDGSLSLVIPFDLPLGYHTVRVTVSAREGERRGSQSLVVVPDGVPSVREVAGRDAVFGVIANLYTVRSRRNWGVGDLSDLGGLLEWTAEAGGEFLGVNPLHALRNRGAEVSPYSPVSRVFRNPLYLDVTAVPELAGSPEAGRMLDSGTVPREIEALRASDRVAYDRIIDLKLRALRAIHRASAPGAPGAAATPSGRAYRAFVEEQGEPLRLFATFEALVEHLGTGDWREWPDGYRAPDAAAVRAFQAARPEEIDFHCWLQFELDRQLGAAAARGRAAGLGIGVYQDLAIGTSPGGADVWARPHLFLHGVSIGAPPDEYSASGQNWGLPPLDPRVLRDDGYRYWIQLARASLRHAGALRIDHVMGLFRQFWIPEGMGGEHGAYVRFPAEDLLGILALEAHRHRALVVGEDLGTVPPEVPPALRRWGILSSRVLYFERDGESFREASRFEPMALATANTHDMPTLAGFWRGRDIEIKREVGLIGTDEEAEEERRTRARDRRALLERLAAEGVLPDVAEPRSAAELRGAVHAFLCRTPSAMVGLSLDDIVGEVEPVNLPGVSPDRFSSWTRRLATPLEAFASDPEIRSTMRCERSGAGGGPGSAPPAR
jgi:4-alpha-glucanotransferase